MTVVARKARDEYSSKFVHLDELVLDTSDCFVQQSQAAECDINNIMARYERDGVITHVNRYEGNYGDFAQTVPYHEALNVVLNAEECFMSLPADIRKRFSNDPGEFLEFATNPANRDEMAHMGLLPSQNGETGSVANEPSGEAEAAA